MNKIQFKLHRKFFGDKKLDNEVLNYLYKNYLDYNERLKLTPVFNEEDYKSICSVIYSVLGLRVTDTDFMFIINRFTLFLVKDQFEGSTIDINWIITNVQYLSLGTKDTNLNDNKYKQSLNIIRDCLKEKFDVEEKKLRK